MNLSVGMNVSVHLRPDTTIEPGKHGSTCWLGVEDEHGIRVLTLFGSAANARQLAKSATAWAEALDARELTRDERGEAA